MLSGWKIAIGAIGIMGAIGMTLSLVSAKNKAQENAEYWEGQALGLQKELKDAVKTANENAAALEEAKEQAARTLAIVVRERDEARERSQEVREIIRIVEAAPDMDDAPVAPVLGIALDSLRRDSPDGGGSDREGGSAEGQGS